jgi:isocitrate dehydrogenase
MQKSYNGLPLPNGGEPIQYADGKYTIPDHPIIPFIEGDGTGRDIWRASQRVFDAAVEKAYGGRRSVKWFEIFAGEKAFSQFSTWLPDDSVSAARDLRISIKGPLTTPVFVRSTWPCGKSSIFIPACGRSSITRAFPAR